MIFGYVQKVSFDTLTKDMHIESNTSNIQKLSEKTVYFENRFEIRNRNHRSSIISKYETVLTIFQNKFDKRLFKNGRTIKN